MGARIKPILATNTNPTYKPYAAKNSLPPMLSGKITGPTPPSSKVALKIASCRGMCGSKYRCPNTPKRIEAISNRQAARPWRIKRKRNWRDEMTASVLDSYIRCAPASIMAAQHRHEPPATTTSGSPQRGGNCCRLAIICCNASRLSRGCTASVKSPIVCQLAATSSGLNP
ncbi:hypothetical protein D3C78_521820 [compost metagenome]